MVEITQVEEDTLAGSLGIRGDAYGVRASETENCDLYTSLEEALSMWLEENPVCFSDLTDGHQLYAMAFDKFDGDNGDYFEISETRLISLGIDIQTLWH